MAVENKGGSDLDVFEGLGKKAGPRTSQAPAPPPAPPRSTNGPPPPPPSLRSGDNGAKAGPIGFPTPPPVSQPPPPLSQRSAPPPPPGRGALPAVASPPSRSPAGLNVATPVVPPPPVSKSKPPTASAAPASLPKVGAKIDMDWDDDEEATHVFDKDREGSQAEALPKAPPVSRSSLPVSKPLPAPAKPTLLGNSGPPPPPPSLSGPPQPLPLPPPPQTLRGGAMPPPPPPSAIPPPPSSVGSAFARASSVNASSPGPVLTPPPPPDRGPGSMKPPQANTVPMGMPPRSGPAPAMPPPSAASSYRPPPPDIAPLPAPAPLPNRMEATALVRPPEREQNRGLLYAGIVFGLVIVFGVFFFWPRTGEIAINVADAKGAPIPHLEILIDGKKQCESAPCIVSDVPTGSHTVRVEASGFDPTVDKAVAVESRKNVTVDFTLTPMMTATGVKVAGVQPGARLYVDDKEVGPLPQELKDLSPGSHRIKISAGERFVALEKTVNLAQNEMQDLGSVTLKVVKGKATISPGTPGAKVFIVSGSDRRELPTLPISVDIDTTKQWALVASKPGYSDYNQPISFDDGQAEKAFTINLEPKGASPAPPPVAWTPPAAPLPAWHPPPAAPKEPAAPPPPKETASSESGGGGQAFLNINSIPASSVILDGKPIGQTPKLRFAVSAGSHSVLFVNADQGFKKQISVSVGAGETKAAIGRN